MDEKTPRAPELDAPELIAAEPENSRVLKEHELGVKLEYDPDGGGPYVPEAQKCRPRGQTYAVRQTRRTRGSRTFEAR